MSNWAAWRIDFWTIAWIVWMAAFFVLETITLAQGRQQELTAHLRPVLQSNPLIWFVAAGVIGWLAFHFLVQGVWVDVEPSTRGRK